MQICVQIPNSFCPLTLLFSFFPHPHTKACFLLGEGGCSSQDNGKDDDDDDDEDWPLAVGEKSLEECCQKCTKTKGCTAFHLGKAKTSKRLCALYGGQVKLTPGGGEGQCYRVSKKKGKTRGGRTTIMDDDVRRHRSHLEKAAQHCLFMAH